MKYNVLTGGSHPFPQKFVAFLILNFGSNVLFTLFLFCAYLADSTNKLIQSVSLLVSYQSKNKRIEYYLEMG